MHWQNLNEKSGGRHGSGLRHGRCWSGQFGLEWLLFKSPDFYLNLGIGGVENALSFGICLILFSLYFHWENHKANQWLNDKTKRRNQKYGNGREIELYWHQWSLWGALWHDEMESRREDPWYVQMHCLNFPDFILGRAKYGSWQLREERVVVPMPEGGYPATVRINRDTWKRPRWPWPRVRIRSEITPDTPIPHPGKGENSWDCGEDAMYSLYGPYDTPLKAVMAATESAMSDRLRYGGGWDYKPEVKPDVQKQT